MSTRLNEHYEKKVRPHIDLTDSLHALGVETDLKLPAIVVIGDQSSGKSSVLEALSGVPLPCGSGMVTRCPLELKMKKSKNERSHGKISYKDIKEEIQNSTDVDKIIRKAQNEIAGAVDISHELIRLEVTSPNVPDLTLIDLPGIAHVPMKGQPEDIREQSKSLIRKFITNQDTIILVVMPCNLDIATTEALKMAQEVDPHGTRTLVILTKADLVDRDMEETVMSNINNKLLSLKKGYMIVRYRGQQEINKNIPLHEAVEKEKDFFINHPHFRTLYNEGKATIPNLAEKLTLNLVDHIKEVIDEELQLYEKKYRGRELPGFINYNTFEMMFRTRIKQLEEPAVLKMREISDFIMEEFIQLAEDNFLKFPNLLKITRNKIIKIKKKKELEAESMLRTQFKMELMIYTQDSIYSEILKMLKEKLQEDERKAHGVPRSHSYCMYNLSDIEDALEELTTNLMAYYSIVNRRLADQVPLVIRYMVLQESAAQLQREMIQLTRDNDVNFLLEEIDDNKIKLDNLKRLQNSLKEALKKRD
ncbi:interferon-induced GTP-binding protein Mx1-like [Clarias gariepinus]